MTQKPSSHHQRILEDVRTNILKGKWPPGWRIPFETEMAEDYGVSRMTVNKALTQLAREGYLERRRKGGSFVALPRHQSAVMEINDLKQEVQSAGRSHSLTLLRSQVRPANDSDAHNLDLGANRPELRALLTLHKADGQPYCVEDRVINLAAIPEARDVDFGHEPAGTWLLKQVPWSLAEHIIRAVAATVADAKLLDIAPGAPCLAIDRVTRREGQPLTYVRFLYPGSQHQVAARFMSHT